jgi:hypothetical protein
MEATYLSTYSSTQCQNPESKNLLQYLLLILLCVLFNHLITATVRIFKTFLSRSTKIPEVCWNSNDKKYNYEIVQNKIVHDIDCSYMKIMIFSRVGTRSHYLVFNQPLTLIYILLYPLLFIRML